MFLATNGTDKINPAQTDSRHRLVPHVAKGFAINFAGIASRMVIAYLFTFIIARLLSQSDLGQFFLMSSIIELLALFSTVGLGMAVTRYVSLYAGERNYGHARQALGTGLGIGAAVSLAVALLLVILAPFLADPFFDGNHGAIGLMRIFALSIPLLVVARIFNATTQGMHMMKYQVYSRDLAEQVSLLLLATGLLVLGLGLTGLIVAKIAALVIAAAFSMLFAIRVLPRPVRGESALPHPAKSMVLYSLPLIISSMVVAMQFRIDTLLLGYLGSTAQVGLYGVALKLAFFTNRIDQAFGTVFSPMIADLWNRGRKAELEQIFKTVTRWIFISSYPVFLLFMAFPAGILNIFGRNFREAATALSVLAIGQMTAAATGNAGLMVLMSGRSWLELLNVAAGVILNVAVSFLLIPRYGLVGAAIGNTAGTALINLLRLAEVMLFMQMHPYDLSFLRPLAFGTAGAAAVGFVNRFFFAEKSPLMTVALAGAFLLFYLVVVITGLNEQDHVVIDNIKRRFRRPGPGAA